MEYDVNLDRAVKLKISYPIGVKETLTFTYNDLTNLTDTYQVLISKSRSDRDVFITISEGSGLSRATNILTWNLEFNHIDMPEGNYGFEIRNITQDYIEFSGTLKALKTIDNG